MLSTTERMAFDARFAALAAVDQHSVIAEGDRHAHSIKDVGAGGVIRVSGETFVVKSTATYTETNDSYKKPKKGAYQVTELVLFSLKTGNTRYIEWVVDDELEVSFTDRKLSTSEMNRYLQDDEGQPFDIDEDIDEACENKWAVMFKSKTYDFDSWWSFIYQASDGRSEKGCMYEFGSKELGWLTVEGWDDKGKWDYEGYLSADISPSIVEVIVVGGDVVAKAAA